MEEDGDDAEETVEEEAGEAEEELCSPEEDVALTPADTKLKSRRR